MACPPPPSYCTAGECEEPTRQGRRFCEFHEKRFQRGQSLTAPKQERLSPNERVVEAALRFAEADSEDDAEYEKSKRDLFRAARQAGATAAGELVRQGHVEARRRGVHIGRPPEVTHAQALEVVSREGSIAAAARALGKSRPTIYRALGRVTKDGVSLQASRAA